MWLLEEHHVATSWELYLVVSGAGFSLLSGALVATFYLALEPHVRRRWPSVLVAWSRLLAGDVFNPLVARDVLIGAAIVGVAYSVDLSGMLLTRRVTGVLPFLDSSSRPFLGGLHLIAALMGVLISAVFTALVFLLVYDFIRLVVRLEWAAVLIGALLMGLSTSGAVGGGGLVVRLPFEFAFSATMFFVLARAGLVATIAAWTFLFLLKDFPFTWPLTQWYSMTGLIGLALSAALVIAAYRIVMRAQARPVRT
jgi:hypothetical protein